MEDNILYKVLEFLGVDPGVIFPSIMGTLVAIKRMKNMSIIKSISSIFFGLICSVYLTPIFINFLPENNKLEYSIAFLVGYSGLTALDLIFYHINKYLDKKNEKNK